VVGYAGGSTANPTYQSIGDHTEAMRVEFDPRVVSYEELLLKFWQEHDPMPFAFTGYQYRSALWPHTPTQRAIVDAVKARLDGNSPFGSDRQHTAIEQPTPFYRAEEYHQKFLAKQTGRFSVAR